MDSRNTDTTWFDSLPNLIEALRFVKANRRVVLIKAELGAGPLFPQLKNIHDLISLVTQLEGSDPLALLELIKEDLPRLVPDGKAMHNLVYRFPSLDRLALLKWLTYSPPSLTNLLFCEPMLFELTGRKYGTPIPQADAEAFCATLPHLRPANLTTTLRCMHFNDEIEVRRYLMILDKQLPSLLTTAAQFCDFYTAVENLPGIVPNEVYQMLRDHSKLIKDLFKSTDDFIAATTITFHSFNIFTEILHDELPALFPRVEDCQRLLKALPISDLTVTSPLAVFINSRFSTFTDVLRTFEYLKREKDPENDRYCLRNVIEVLTPFLKKYITSTAMLVACLKQMPVIHDKYDSWQKDSAAHARKILVDALEDILPTLPTTANDVDKMDGLLADNHLGQIKYYRIMQKVLPTILSADQCKKVNENYGLNLMIPPKPALSSRHANLFSANQPAASTEGASAGVKPRK